MSVDMSGFVVCVSMSADMSGFVVCVSVSADMSGFVVCVAIYSHGQCQQTCQGLLCV